MSKISGTASISAATRALLPDDATVEEEHLLTFSTRLSTSPVGKQVNSRLRSGPAYTFYGPAGAVNEFTKPAAKFWDPKASACPGPDTYDASRIALHAVSTKLTARKSTFSQASAWNEQQIQRLNAHRARQQDLPSVGDLHVMAMEAKAAHTQYPRAHFARQSTHRPFFAPLETSARFIPGVTKQRERALALRAEKVQKARAAAGLAPYVP